MVRLRVVVHGRVQGVFFRTGPDRAQVTRVELTDLEPTGDVGFSIH